MKLVGKCQQRLQLLVQLPHFSPPTNWPAMSAFAPLTTVFYFPTSEQQQELQSCMFHSCPRRACIVFPGFLMTCTADDDSFSRVASAFTADGLPRRRGGNFLSVGICSEIPRVSNSAPADLPCKMSPALKCFEQQTTHLRNYETKQTNKGGQYDNTVSQVICLNVWTWRHVIFT